MGWMLPFRQAWLGCGFFPRPSGALQPAWLLGTCLLLLPMRSLWQAANMVLLPTQESSCLPQDGEPWPRMLVRCKTMVVSTALYPPECSIGKKIGVDDQAFQISFAEPPSSPSNASERTRESWVIFVVFLLCAVSCWAWPFPTYQYKQWGRIDFSRLFAV